MINEPTYTDPVPPSTNQYRLILIQCHQVPTIAALYWPSTQLYSRNAQLSQLDLVNIAFLACTFFWSQYACGEARKIFWEKKSMLNFSRQAHTGKVMDYHRFFRIIWFLSSDFLEQEYSSRRLCPKYELRFR